MDKIDYLYNLSKFGIYNDDELASLYKLDAENYDYENNKHEKRLEEILKKRNIKEDIAHLLNCDESEIAFLNEPMSPNVKYLYTGLHIVNIGNHDVLNGRTADVKRYLDYVQKQRSEVHLDDENKSKDTEGIVEKLIKKCVIPDYARRPYRPKTKEISKDKVVELVPKPTKYFVVAGSMIAAIMFLSSPMGPDEVDKFIDDNRYIISNEKVRTDDNSGFYYLHNNIAKNILNSGIDQDALIYVVYREVRRDASTINGHDEEQIDYNMDLIMRDISFNSDNYEYSDFDSYLIGKNYINQNGAADEKIYDKMMHEKISEMLKNNNYSFDGGKLK